MPYLISGLMTCGGRLDRVGEMVAAFNDISIVLAYLCPYPRVPRKRLQVEGPGNDGRYVVHLRNDAQRERAVRICDSLRGLFALNGYGFVEGFDAIHVPSALTRKDVIHRDALVKHHFPGDFDRFLNDDFHHAFSRAIGIPLAVLKAMFSQLKPIYESNEIFEGIQMYAFAVRDIVFSSSSFMALKDRTWTAKTSDEKLKMESSVLNAFRSVEALVGEPGQAERLKDRMRRLGINPDALARFEDKRPIYQEISWLQELRDSTSAHGMRRRRQPLSYFEVLRAQELAKALLDFAIESRRDDRLQRP